MWKGHSNCRSRSESTLSSLQHNAASGPHWGEGTLYHCCLEQTVNHSFFDRPSFIEHISNIPSFIIILHAAFVSILSAPVASIHLCIFSPSQCVSIPTSLVFLSFLSVQQLCHPIVASLFCRLDAFTPASGLQHYKAPQIKKGKHNLYSGPRLWCERKKEREKR